MYEYMFRLIIIGDCSVGKTAFATKLMHDHFCPRYDATIGVDYSAKTLILNNTTRVKCQLWDTAGQENFAPLIKTYYKDIAGAILMYDISDKRTYNNLKFWIKELNNNGPTEYPVSKLLIGNKLDRLERTISYKEAEEFANRNGFIYTEMSVKQDYDISNTLKIIAEDIYLHIEKNKGVKKNECNFLLTEKNEGTKNRDCCCLF